MPQYKDATVRQLTRRIDEQDLFLPLIQRDVVWSKDQILFLIDSLLRGYPIGALLLWRTDTEVRARRFVAKYRTGMRLGDFEVQSTRSRREYVLDGQQRLQALYIALYGSYDGEEVVIDLLSTPESAAEYELRYALSFEPVGSASSPTKVRIRDIAMSKQDLMPLVRSTQAKIRQSSPDTSDADLDRVADVISRIQSVFIHQESLTYFTADPDENASFANLDEVLEVFIRVNSGGTKLEMSDLLFAIVKSAWADAQDRFEEFLDELNAGGLFTFDKDDLLRVALLLTGHGASYEISRLRGPAGDELVRVIGEQWTNIQQTVRETLDFATERAQLRTQKILRSKNALMPLMSYLHRARAVRHRPTDKDKLAMQRWLYRVLLERQFGGQSVTLLNRCDQAVRAAADAGFPEVALLKELRLPPTLANDSILDRGRGTTQESVLPTYIAYLQAGMAPPAFAVRISGNVPEVDHIVPRSWLRKKYEVAGQNGDEVINNVGNYRLLEKDENADKSDRLPDEYYASPEANAQFRHRHFIPSDVPLGSTLTLDIYEGFVRARRRVLYERIREAVSTQTAGSGSSSRSAREGELWDEGETVLAYELLRNHGAFPSATAIADLARDLNRSDGSVSRKIANLMAAQTEGSGLSHRSKLDDQIAARFHDDVQALHAAAGRARAELAAARSTESESGT